MLKKPYSIYTVKEFNIVNNARYHIFTYTKLNELEQFLVDYDFANKVLICDEIHCLGNKKNKQSNRYRLNSYTDNESFRRTI